MWEYLSPQTLTLVQEEEERIIDEDNGMQGG
jgi:hypothetical protein